MFYLEIQSTNFQFSSTQWSVIAIERDKLIALRFRTCMSRGQIIRNNRDIFSI